MKRASLLLTAAFAICGIWATTAGAADLGRTVLVGGNPAHRVEYQAWIDAAAPLAKQVNTEVKLRESNCPGSGSSLAACVISSTHVEDPLLFYIPSKLRNKKYYVPEDLKNTVLHELGHVYDFLYTADRHRQAWMDVFGIAGRFYSDKSTRPPYERFAVAYSYCAEGLTAQQARKRKKYDYYRHRFTAFQYAASCAILHP